MAMTEAQIDSLARELYPGLFRVVSTLVRLSFRCERCGAEHVTERRYASVRRFLDRSARNLPVPYLRCPCCKQRRLGQVGYAEMVKRSS